LTPAIPRRGAALRHTPRLRAALALACGAASVLGYSPVDAFVVWLAATAVLAHLWVRAETPRAAAWTGFWYGLGLFGAGVSWVYVSMSEFGNMAAPLAVVATLGLCAFLALFPALAGWLQARWAVTETTRACLVIPGMWTFTDWLRGWLLTGFPWLAPGYAAIDSPLAGFAPLGGVHAVTLASLACAGLLWCVVHARPRWPAIAGIAAIFAAGVLLRAVAWTVPAGAPVSASLLQGNIPQALKFSAERYAHMLETYARLAEASTARLVVLPETAVPRYLDNVSPHYLARLEAVARRNGGDLLLGVPTRSAAGQAYNSAVTLGVSPRQAYHKEHLVPFGEFVPPGFGWVVRVLSIPMSDFARGARDQPALAVAGQAVAVNVCYEDAFAEEIARRARDATLLVNVSNVAWFGDSLAPAQHLQISRMRSLETGRATLTVANTGITAAIDRDGRVLARLPQFVEAKLEVAAPVYAGLTPYLRAGDTIALGAILVVLLAARVGRPRGERSSF
jgi:apolipoprotein N-acyltransferase